jgi:hypothetical protein
LIKRILSGAVVAAVGVTALSAGVAFAQPTNPPARFAGTVTVNGAPAPAGSAVEARIGSTVCGTTTTFSENNASNYVVDVPASDAENQGCGTDGATVQLFVNGQAAGSGPWRNFELNNVNLSVGAATSTPTATATTTGTATARPTTPSAPQTGTGGSLQSSDGNSSLLMIGIGGLVIAAAAGAAVGARRLGRNTIR